MVDISVIIVNYNVRYFIEQCLISVYNSTGDLNVEIIVVDNNSVDNSVESIKSKFPGVVLIENKENLGFAKANNQALKIAKGKYVLLLNPDTLVEEDTLYKCYDYMEQNQDTGALGVKLIDGEGKFLPESKRGFPTLSSSFYRLTGLSKLFPRSKLFNQYNLGFLDEDKTVEVDVLCGAFMFVRSSILEDVGLLDEDFFMYGEDIDFSYRIKRAGYKVVYYPETKIVHFKGESTKKSTLKYHNIFYKAMSIFAKKHYGKSGFNPLLYLINFAVAFFAAFNLLKSFAKKYFLSIIDFVLCFVIFYGVQKFWADFHFHNPQYYDVTKTSILFVVFSLIFTAGIYINGGYSKSSITNVIKGITFSTLIILVFYSLLPEHIRYSRAIILISSVIIFFVFIIIRLIFRKYIGYISTIKDHKKIAIAGNINEVDRVKRIMDINGVDFTFAGFISPQHYDESDNNEQFLGTMDKIEDIIMLNNIDELIFCLKDINMNHVMNLMSKIGKKVHIKVVPEESYGIIGSSDRNSKGEFYSLEINYKFDDKTVLLSKYFLDKIIALFLLLLFPLIKLLNKDFSFRLIKEVLSGRKTWISYIGDDEKIGELPRLKEGIFAPVFLKKYNEVTNNYLHDINVLYARNYNIWMDMEFLFKHLLSKT